MGGQQEGEPAASHHQQHGYAAGLINCAAAAWSSMHAFSRSMVEQDS